MSLCPCGSNRELLSCCGPLISGTPAPTAEALMRSRYTAYVQGNLDYIAQTCAPEAMEEFNRSKEDGQLDDVKWLGLEILKATQGTENDQTGIVEFALSYEFAGKTFTQHEVSTFCRCDGKWAYQTGDATVKILPTRVTQVGRNDPCSCGSGKKFKKCCGA